MVYKAKKTSCHVARNEPLTQTFFLIARHWHQRSRLRSVCQNLRSNWNKGKYFPHNFIDIFVYVFDFNVFTQW
jgi:hypothetical protein